MESLLPFLQGTCTPYNMPVYPGAQCKIADAWFRFLWSSEEHIAPVPALLTARTSFSAQVHRTTMGGELF